MEYSNGAPSPLFDVREPIGTAFFAGSQLVCVSDTGKITACLSGQTFDRTFDSARDLLSSFFDPLSRRLVHLNSLNEVRAIGFSAVCPPYLVEASRVIDIRSNLPVAVIPDFSAEFPQKVKAIPFELFPLQSVATRGTNRCIVGRTGIVLLTERSLFFEPSISAIFALWVGPTLAIISTSSDLILYSDDLTKTCSTHLDRVPLFVHACGDRLIATYDTHFLSIGPDLTTIRTDTRHKLQKAFVLEDESCYLLTLGGSVVALTTDESVFDNCEYAWSDGLYLFVFLESGLTIVNSTHIAKFDSLAPAWSFGHFLFEVCPDCSFRVTNFQSRLVPIGSAFYGQLREVLHSSDLEAKFGELLRTEFSFEELSCALAQVDTNTLPRLLDLLSEQLLAGLCSVGFDFSGAFPTVKPSTQARVLRYLTPGPFEALVRCHLELLAGKESRFKEVVVRKAIVATDFVKALRFAAACRADFVWLLRERSDFPAVPLTSCVELVRKNWAEWGDEKETLEDLGEAFDQAGLGNWAVACFWILGKEERITAILTEQPFAMLAAMTVTREKPDDPIGVFIRGLDIGV
jgi:hypothetical protein